MIKNPCCLAVPDSSSAQTTGFIRVLSLTLLAAFLSACAGHAPVRSEQSLAALPDCPTSPNCIYTHADDAERRVPEFVLRPSANASWPENISMAVLRLPRAQLAETRERYLRFEFRSPLMGFVDDLEILLLPDNRTLAVRSASRLGYSDFGVNRRRVEKLREAFVVDGVIEE